MNWSLLQANGIPTKDDSDTGRGWNKILLLAKVPGVAREKKIKIWGKSAKGFLSYAGTYKQTNRDYNFIYN